VFDTVSRLRYLTACIAALVLLCSPVCADGEYNPWQVFGIDEIRLGGMKHNLESGRGKGGVGYTFTREGGVDVNAEVLFNSPWPKPENAIIDFLLRPRPIFGATVSHTGRHQPVLSRRRVDPARVQHLFRGGHVRRYRP
jgi:hypothetical protein